MNTVIVKGRVFAVDDTVANQIEHMCSQSGSEVKLGPSGEVKEAQEAAKKRQKEDEEAAKSAAVPQGRGR